MHLQQIIKDAVDNLNSYSDEPDVRFRNDYSGRGMYGRQCVGIVGTESECMRVIGQVIKQARIKLMVPQMGSSELEGHQLFEEVVDTMLDFSQDTMSLRSVIMYWPELIPIVGEIENA